MTKQHEWKKVYHLMGEQTIPVFQTVIQFSPDVEHYLISTEKTEKAAENLERVLNGKGYRVSCCCLGSEDVSTSFHALAPKINKIFCETNPDRQLSLFNITGGTKPMSLVSYMYAERQQHIKCAYLNSYERLLLVLNNDEHIPISNRMEIADFVAICGCHIKSKTSAPVKEIFLDTARFLFRHSKYVQEVQAEFAACSKKMKDADRKTRCAAAEKQFAGRLKEDARAEWNGLWTRLCSEKGYNDIRKRAEFLGGTWFEYYTFQYVIDHIADAAEVLLNVKIAFNNAPEKTAQEFDVVYTDGFQLIILECKAGKIEQNYVQKLENLREKYTGAIGKTAFVTLNPSTTSHNQKESFATRVQESRAIAAFCGKNALEQLREKGFDFKAGQIYGE